ncbi:ATP-binding protein [Deinococcus sp. UR1]|uniref:ATP-binding protein n=1 Tax=Deinococcus sp. UR1 TaxID=1704277 RepID=UPI0006DC9152|nr:ATP-binding protein [Deinococcus sp. UR1]PIG96818.1 transcriptional regulator [Deinococcus sp. UR1]
MTRPSIPELLERLGELDEGERIEAKRGQQAGKSILETICAFSNEPGLDGGFILLGVEKDPGALLDVYAPVGISDPDNVINTLATQTREMFNVPLRPEVWQERVNGKLVIAVRVHEASAEQKPVYLKATGLPKGAFRRIGNSDQRCTEDDLNELYQGRATGSYDDTIVPDATLEDIDAAALEDYRAERRKVNASAEELEYSDNDLLKALSGIRQDSRGTWRPTVAGILLFGTSIALRRFFPLMRVDYIRIIGKQWIEDADHRFDTVELRAPLMRLVRRTEAAILDDLMKSFRLPEGQLQAQQTPAIPQRVIREGLVNALMHRSYRQHSPVQIIRYANRLEFRNPGYSLKYEERLGEPGSETRNPKIAAALHDTNFAETKGSGIRVMRRLMEESGLTPPHFESDRPDNRFIATYLFHHFLSAEDHQWLRQFQGADLSGEDARALIYARETGAVTNAAYRDLNKFDVLTASKRLKRLCDQGVLESRQKGRATYYELASAWTQVRASEDDTGGAPATPDRPGSGIPDNGLAIPDNGLAIPDNAPAIPDKPPAIPDTIQAQIASLGGRSRKTDVQNVIVELCRLRPFTLEELAHELNRTPKHLSSDYVQPLVRSGALEYTIPDQPKHPKQAYRTTEKDKK